MKKLLLLVWMMTCVFLCAGQAHAHEAQDISDKSLVTSQKGLSSLIRIFDGRTIESARLRDGCRITLTHEAGIGSLYLVFGEEYGPYTVTEAATGQQAVFGREGFLHEFLDLEEAFGFAPEQVTLSFDNGDGELNELSAFTSGQVPDWVQRWQPPAEKSADIALFSAHGDDEQLFFAGLLPYYAGELGYHVQVVYLTGHRNVTMRRSHEMLDGLWAVGVRHYPVFGAYGDYYSTTLPVAYQKYKQKGITRQELLEFVVENIRRFRPKVAVGHDLEGEYGHGMHMMYAELLCEAVEIAGDHQQFPESAMKLGVWEVPKTYLHLYQENQIVMDWDIPLERFGGMTAYEVTRDLGFPCHVSQQSYYSEYFDGMDTASAIGVNSPCEFGLYRSTVGPDEAGNDFMEHLTTHAQDAALAAQQQAREEARQKEQMRQRAESLARQARQAHAATEAPTVQAEPPAPEETPRENWKMAVPAAVFAGFAAIFLLRKRK